MQQSRFDKLIELVKTCYKCSIPEGYRVHESDYSDATNDPDSWMSAMQKSFMQAKFENSCLFGLNLECYGLGEFRNIYVRDAYYEMLEEVLERLKKPRTRYRYLVLGSSGVGKSMFHAFCLYVLLQAGAPVYFVYRDFSALFFEDKVYKPLVRVHECRLLTYHNVWFLYDSLDRPPSLTSDPIGLVFFTPRHIYNSYVKELSCPPMYLPLWEFDELQVANSILPEGNLPPEVLLRRYDYCGWYPTSYLWVFQSLLCAVPLCDWKGET